MPSLRKYGIPQEIENFHTLLVSTSRKKPFTFVCDPEPSDGVIALVVDGIFDLTRLVPLLMAQGWRPRSRKTLPTS